MQLLSYKKINIAIKFIVAFFVLTYTIFISSAAPYFLSYRPLSQVPDLSAYKRIRFLTTPDFPPFNFVNQDGELLGYNIDLVKELCIELQIESKCQIKVVLWKDLLTNLGSDEGEVILAGLVPTKEARTFVNFTPYYLRFPARFVLNKSYQENYKQQGLFKFIASNVVGVVANTVHEKLFALYFPNVKVKTYDNSHKLYEALQRKEIKIGFGDSFTISRWLKEDKNSNCCEFVAGNYIAPQLLTAAMSMAVKKKDYNLLYGLTYGLQAIERKGKLQGLYLRYFPLDFWQ